MVWWRDEKYDKGTSISLIFLPGLSHENNVHKMRVLTFMSLGESTSEVSFDDLCKELNIGTEEIEDFIIEGLFHCARWF